MHFCIHSSGSDLPQTPPQRRDAARLGAKLGQGSPVRWRRTAPCAAANWPGFSAESHSFRGCWGCWGFWAALGLPYTTPTVYLGPANKGTNGSIQWIRHYKKMPAGTGVANGNGWDGGCVLRVFFFFCFPCFDTNRGQEYEGVDALKHDVWGPPIRDFDSSIRSISETNDGRACHGRDFILLFASNHVHMIPSKTTVEQWMMAFVLNA